MALTCNPLALPEVLCLVPDVFRDPRGFFLETCNTAKYAALGITKPFVQDNFSRSCGNTLRGLHYQARHPQAKLVAVSRGSIFDVAVDIRRGSPTFGRWVGRVLSDENHEQLYIPAGFAHGFSVLSPEADVFYKCTDFYDRDDDRGILWNDPALGIDWQVTAPLLSAKDQQLPCLSAVPPEQLPAYAG